MWAPTSTWRVRCRNHMLSWSCLTCCPSYILGPADSSDTAKQNRHSYCNPDPNTRYIQPTNQPTNLDTWRKNVEVLHERAKSAPAPTGKRRVSIQPHNRSVLPPPRQELAANNPPRMLRPRRWAAVRARGRAAPRCRYAADCWAGT